MTDVLTESQRSFCMAQIKGKNTKPEIVLRKALWSKGYRYRLKSKLAGKPDIVFPQRKIAIFVDGCFWHKCPEHYIAPKQNSDFWEKKISGNVKRDQKVNRQLERSGWTVIRVWEHEIKSSLESCIDGLITVLQAK